MADNRLPTTTTIEIANLLKWSVALMVFCVAMVTPAFAQSSAMKDRVQAAQTQLAGMSDDTEVTVGYYIPEGMDLAAFRDLSLRFNLPSVYFHIAFPNPATRQQQGTEIAGYMGEWHAHHAEPWSKTICQVRMQIADLGGGDVSESMLRVRSASAYATVGAIRKTIAAGGGALQLSSIQALTKEDFAERRTSAKSARVLAIRFVAENYTVPQGCEAHVKQLKGWVQKDGAISRIPPIGASSAVIGALAKDMPDQPIRMTLFVRSGTSIDEIADLVSTHSMAELRIRPMADTTPLVDLSSIHLVFSSEGASLQVQIQQQVCRVRAYRDDLLDRGPEGKSFKLRMPIDRLAVTAVMRAKDAKRFVDQLPRFLEGVMVSEFLYLEAYETWAAISAREHAKPIVARKGNAIPTGCERFVVPQVERPLPNSAAN